MEKKSYQLSAIINEAMEAVERSRVGDIFVKNEDGTIKKDLNGNSFINTFASQTFFNVLSNIIPKDFSSKINLSSDDS